MNRTTRLLIALLLFLGIAFLVHRQAAEAARSLEARLSAQKEQEQSQPVAKDDCENKKGKEKKKCKGTVKPPPFDIIIPVTGEYSVGGFCTLTVDLKDPPVRLNATLIEPLPGELPRDVQDPGQGCLLTYFRSGETLARLLPEQGNVTICFAATPAKQMAVYFYDFYSPTPAWTPVVGTTNLDNGLTCAPANASGVYIATFPL